MKNERVIIQNTETLFDKDGMIMDFTATVLSCEKEDTGSEKSSAVYKVILDRTAFFSEGGGQQSDEGTINGIKVIDVKMNEDGQIVHYLDRSLEVGDVIEGHIDKELRLSRMQNHGAEHLISGLIHKQFGYDNVGFHMSDPVVIFDVSGLVDADALSQIEKRANEIVYENVPITISFPDEEAARKATYRSKLDTYENIRLVSIGDYDVCACCAPHLHSTGQIGAIRIIDSMPHRQGTRITMLAGINALNDYISLDKANRQLMELLSAKRDATHIATNELMDRYNRLREEHGSLKRELSAIICDKVISEMDNRAEDDDKPELIFTDILDNVGLRNLINTITLKFDGIVAGFLGDDKNGYRYICAAGGQHDLQRLAKTINAAFGGKGGGNNQMIQGSIQGSQKDIRDFFINIDI